jgi:hypothetical protein
VYGAIEPPGRRVVKGTLSWYQPRRCCHSIAPFALELGRLLFPDLSWKLLSSDRHTVPVGYDAHGEPRGVMDILLFERFSAQRSLDFADAGMSTEQYQAKWELEHAASERPAPT